MKKHGTDESVDHANYRFIALAIALLTVIGIFECWIILFPNWHAHDIVPPGDDPAVHLRIVTAILSGRGWLVGLPYPPLFHWIVASVAFLTHLSALRAQWIVTTIMIGLLPACIAGILIVRLSKQRLPVLLVGLSTLTALLMLSRMPLRAWGDGNYPDLLAQAILIPALVYCLSVLHGNWNRSVAVMVIGLLGLIFACHAMSILTALTIFFFGMLCIDLPVIHRLQLVGCTIGLGVLAWIKVIGPTLSPSALHLLIQGQGNLVSGLTFVTGQVTPIHAFSDFLGQPFLSITLILIALALTLYAVDASARYVLFLLGIWAASLFVASRIHGLAVPDRFLRDLSYPLIALGATAVTLLARRNIVAALPIGCMILFLGIRWATYINQPGGFLPHPDGVRPIEQRLNDQQAMAFQAIASALPSNAVVITNPTSAYAPFLINHPVTTLSAPSVDNQQLPFYILLGPEPSGSLRSSAESELYHTITDFLETIPGTVIVRNSKLTLTLVTQPVR